MKWNLYLAATACIVAFLIISPHARASSITPSDAALSFNLNVNTHSPSGQFTIGQAYAHGNQVARNYHSALRWYLKAGNQGYSEAFVQIAHIYETGLTGPKNFNQAYHWYLKAANIGNITAQKKVAIFNSSGQHLPTDYSVAAIWFEKAALQGDADAAYFLGSMYFAGKGVAKDSAIALDWYHKAINLNHIDATFAAALIHQTGLGVDANPEKAVDLLTKAANLGHVKSMLKLAQHYQNSGAVNESTQWLKKAKKSGSTTASIKLCKLNAHTFIASIPLMCTNRADFRAAIKSQGALPLRENNRYWGDLYNASTVFKGADTLDVLYNGEGLIDAVEITFKKFGRSANIERIKRRLIKRYGEPAFAHVFKSQNNVKEYQWSLNDGFNLRLYRSREFPSVRLTYTRSS